MSSNTTGGKGEEKFPLAARLLGGLGGKKPADAKGGDPAKPADAGNQTMRTKRQLAKGPQADGARPSSLLARVGASDEAKAALERMGAMLERESKTYAKEPDGYDLLDAARGESPVARASSSAMILAFQRALVAAGVHVAQNGTFDPTLELAIRNFQRKMNVEVSGKGDAATLAALDRALKVKPRSKGKPQEEPLPELPETENAFVDAIAPFAVRAMRETGVPASLSLAMAVLLSSFGERPVARDHKNLFGLEGAGPAGDVVLTENKESKTFRKYHDVAESIRDHARFLKEDSAPHARAIANQAGPDAMARALTDLYPRVPHFGETAIRVMKQFDLYRFDRVS